MNFRKKVAFYTNNADNRTRLYRDLYIIYAIYIEQRQRIWAADVSIATLFLIDFEKYMIAITGRGIHRELYALYTMFNLVVSEISDKLVVSRKGCFGVKKLCSILKFSAFCKWKWLKWHFKHLRLKSQIFWKAGKTNYLLRKVHMNYEIDSFLMRDLPDETVR